MTTTTFTAPTLVRLARDYADRMPWRAWFTPHSRWARRVVHASDHEVWLLGWLPGQGTDLHDHGGNHRPAPAAFAVHQGTLTEYTVSPGEYPALESRPVSAGEFSTVGQRTIHAIRNTADTPAVSVHVYAPRLLMMRRYLCDETGLWLASAKRAGEDW